MDMAMSIFFAKAYAIFFIAVGLALFLNPERFRAWYQEILAQDRRALFGGTVSLLIGSFILAAHNYWVMDWPLLITLIGYWGVFKGAGLLIHPGFVQLFKPMIDSSESVYRMSGIAWAVIGLLLAYHGFGM
jgi:uncharacterized protein YjeT (DUF2065 family)